MNPKYTYNQSYNVKCQQPIPSLRTVQENSIDHIIIKIEQIGTKFKATVQIWYNGQYCVSDGQKLVENPETFNTDIDVSLID